MISQIANFPGFRAWAAGSGILTDDGEGSRLGLITNESDYIRTCHVEPVGACYGFVFRGSAIVGGYGSNLTPTEGEFFQTRNGGSIIVNPGSRVVLMQRLGYLGLGCHGGPIEAKGRLRYIDGCSDTLLIPPALRGEPCLNHLHFPPGIDQTSHTHPSTRFGVVFRGRGECETPEGKVPLLPGVVFHIPTGGVHKFRTFDESMDIIAYHPDSDHGPTHEDHPMVNRTLVDGTKLDNSDPRHAADVINPWL